MIASAWPVLASLGRGAESRGAIPGGGTAALTAERIAELRSPAPPVRPHMNAHISVDSTPCWHR
jgi:hypothetical protein